MCVVKNETHVANYFTFEVKETNHGMLTTAKQFLDWIVTQS